MSVALTRQFLAMTERKKQLEAELEAVKKSTASLERQLVAEFERQGVNSIHMDGHCIYLHRKLVARAADGNRERVIAALLATGLVDYVNTAPTFNTASLEAYVREQLDNGEELAPALKEALSVEEIYFARVRKAS
jgi:hypothetical protein